MYVCMYGLLKYLQLAYLVSYNTFTCRLLTLKLGPVGTEERPKSVRKLLLCHQPSSELILLALALC